MRATFSLTLSGTPTEVEQATNDLANALTDAGYFFDSDWGFVERGWAEGRALHEGIELRTAGAVRAALDALPRAGASLIETNPEL